MGLPFAIAIIGIGLLVMVRHQQPTDRNSTIDGWWWLRFIGQWLLISGVVLWLVWAAIRLIYWLV